RDPQATTRARRRRRGTPPTLLARSGRLPPCERTSRQCLSPRLKTTHKAAPRVTRTDLSNCGVERLVGRVTGFEASHPTRAHGVPHTAFTDPTCPSGTPTRASVEIRGLPLFADNSREAEVCGRRRAI